MPGWAEPPKGTGIIGRTLNNRSYLYTAETTGPEAVEQMKALALAGAGLSSYIARNRPTYARRW